MFVLCHAILRVLNWNGFRPYVRPSVPHLTDTTKLLPIHSETGSLESSWNAGVQHHGHLLIGLSNAAIGPRDRPPYLGHTVTQQSPGCFPLNQVYWNRLGPQVPGQLTPTQVYRLDFLGAQMHKIMITIPSVSPKGIVRYIADAVAQ